MTTDTTQPAVITDPEMEAAHYGITVAHIGDDGEGLIALGHHEPRRVLAAFNRHSRVFVGLAAIWDCPELTVAELLPLIRQERGLFRKPADGEDPDFAWVLDSKQPDHPDVQPVTVLWPR